MKSANDKSHNARVPAENYRERAGAVLERMLMQMRAVAGPGRWKEPTEAQMAGFIDEFHVILNWALAGTKRLGYPVEQFPGPLTEAEMRWVESRLLADVAIIRFDGGGILFAKKFRS
jgi:hypothetical protein